MRRIAILTLISAGALAAVAIPSISQAQTTYSGTVERVWEDGFRLDTGDRTLRVDSWDVYGDNTASNIEVGETISVTGEFSGRDFDAFSINRPGEDSTADTASADTADTTDYSEAASPAGVSYTGTVENVWEDGFQLNTGDRTLRVDSWDVYGDSTASNVTTGDRITVTGEFSGRDFDAFSIATAEQTTDEATPAAQ
ncbi:MAG: hypothetical protein AAGI69_23585 [Cyanobacteria bacterium P01_H01_bin.21]